MSNIEIGNYEALILNQGKLTRIEVAKVSLYFEKGLDL